jgi:apolipoprotein N-acyltransferase
MQRMTREDKAPAGVLAGAVYGRAWRLVVAALRVESRAGLLLVTGLLLFGSGVDLTPPFLLRAVTVLAALPALAAWLLERAFAARLAIADAEIVVHGRGRRLEIPRAAVVGAVPWRVPLPRPGVTLRLRSGGRLDVALDDPGALLALLGVWEGRDHAVVHWAAAGARRGAMRWDLPLVRFPLFALVPGVILFRTHQWIAYGGTFGQYYLLGLRAFLVTFAVYWTTVTIYLVLWANLWRLLVEAVALVGAYAAPEHAAPLRRAAERADVLLYYGGALLVLLVRLLP